MLGKTVADFRKESVEPAKDSIKMRLVLEAVYNDAKIEATDAEVEEKIKELAKSYGRKEEELKENEELVNSVKANIKSEKGIALIVDNAKIKVVEPKEEKEERLKRYMDGKGEQYHQKYIPNKGLFDKKYNKGNNGKRLEPLNKNQKEMYKRYVFYLQKIF